MYEEGFRWWNLGQASAVAFMLFVLMHRRRDAGLLRLGGAAARGRLE